MERVAYMFLALCEHWTFTHQNQLASSNLNAEYRRQRGLVAAKLGVEVQRAMLNCIGTKTERTYGHDMVYGLPKLYKLVGKPYLGATEGNESAHQEVKKFFKIGGAAASPLMTMTLRQGDEKEKKYRRAHGARWRLWATKSGPFCLYFFLPPAAASALSLKRRQAAHGRTAPKPTGDRLERFRDTRAPRVSIARTQHTSYLL